VERSTVRYAASTIREFRDIEILPVRRNCDTPTLSDLQEHRLPESVLNSTCIEGLFKFVAGPIKPYLRGLQEHTDASSIAEFNSTRNDRAALDAAGVQRSPISSHRGSAWLRSAKAAIKS
jgi:hypothetical protein